MMENEIQGGAKRYEHVQFGMISICKRDRGEVRFHKKPWVPQWLWELLGTADPFDIVEAAFKRAEEKRNAQLVENLAAGGATKGKDGGE